MEVLPSSNPVPLHWGFDWGVKGGVGFVLKRHFIFVNNKESALEERKGKSKEKLSLLIRANFLGTKKRDFAG